MWEFLLLIMPTGSGAAVFLFRWLKSKTLISGFQVDVARKDAHLEAAREAAAVAQGTAEQQRELLGDFIERVAKRVEHMDQTMTGVAGFLTDQVQWRPGDTRALPGPGGQRAVTAGDEHEGHWS